MKHTHIFRKLVATFLVMATMLPVFACTPRKQGKATPNPTAAIETPEPDLTPYKGDGSEYVSIYTDERDKACEADIVKLADVFLNPYNGHAKLADIETPVRSYTYPSSYEYATENFYDPELRNEFLKKINELIISVPELTEFEIIAGLAETVALLKEGHSVVDILSKKMFPLGLTPIFNENGVEFYATRVNNSDADCLMARLDAINGISTNEILERMRPFISYEVDSYFYSRASYNILGWSILNHIDVIDDSDSAVFSFTDAFGKSFEKEFKAIEYDEQAISEAIPYLVYTFGEVDRDYSLLNTRYLIGNFEYRYLKDETVLYIRISQCTWDGRDVVSEMFEKIHAENKDLESIIIDFRHNGGGYVDYVPPFIVQLQKMDESIKKYILIDEAVYSGAIISAACIRRAFENATLVGVPGGSPVSEIFCTNPDGVELPYLGTKFYCGRSPCYNCWPGYEHDVLTPDRIIYQTYEDYLNGVDTVMKALLSE